MVVPSFTDLGKGARDVFKSGYHYGKSLIVLNVKTRSSGNFEMTSDMNLHCDASKLIGSVEGKYRTRQYGSLTEKWNTDGTLTVGYSQDFTAKSDATVSTEFAYNPESSNKNASVTAKAANNAFNAACGICGSFAVVQSACDLNSRVNMLLSVVVGNWKDLLVGYQAGYNTETNKLTKNDLALAYTYSNVGLHFRLTSIPNECGLSVLYRVNPDWDFACNGIFARNGNGQDWTVGAGAKYKVDDKSTFRFKFNNDLQLGTSLQQKLDENVTLTLSFNVDCANVRSGCHKVGLALNIDA